MDRRTFFKDFLALHNNQKKPYFRISYYKVDFDSDQAFVLSVFSWYLIKVKFIRKTTK